MKLILAILILTLIGCATPVKKTQLPYAPTHIEVTQTKNVRWDSIVASGMAELIPLETTEESLFGQVERLFVTDSQYLIIANNSLYLFDENGKSLNII